MYSFLLPQAFVAYAFLIALTGCHTLAVIVICGMFVALLYYRNPQSSIVDSDAVLQGSENKPSIIAHRGAGHDAPENTLAAVREAKKNGADAVEFDVDYTLDGIPVVIHDDTVDRTTDGVGNVDKMTLDTIKSLSASAKHPNKAQFPDERIPSLEEMVQLCLELEMKMYIDVKGNAKLSAEALSSLFAKYPALYQNAIVCSFYPQVVYLVKRRDPRIITALTHRTHYLTRKVDGTEKEGPFYAKLVTPLLDCLLKWSIYNWLWYLCGTSAFLSQNGDVSRIMVEHFRKRNIKVVVWTVNNPIEKRFVSTCLKCSYITDTLSTDGCGHQVN